MDATAPDPGRLYRLPWSTTDNAIAWYEPTSMCNLACDGCYRDNVKDSHKPLDLIRRELDAFRRLRNADCLNIAGGDPLLHPEIVAIVAEVRRRGWKPIVVTNGVLLTPELARDLKRAGAFGFTLHVDSRQGRPGRWRGKSETELNELRLEYAELLARAGDLVCTFDCTVYEDTLAEVPGLIDWAHRHIDLVQTMVFIAIRRLHEGLPFDWLAGGRPVARDALACFADRAPARELLSTDLLGVAREAFPGFAPCACLPGTERPVAFKWLMTERVGTTREIYGYGGPRFVELAMTAHHLLTGRYLSHLRPRRRGTRAALLALWPLDAGVRRAAGRMLVATLRRPANAFRRAYFQTVMFIQPVDFLPDGRQDMCDGCPDATIWRDRVVPSCRLGELERFGAFVTSVPRGPTPVA